MKLLLTSGGVRNASIHNASLELLGKPISECTALCIPTAGFGHPLGSPTGAWRFFTGRQSVCPMIELGWKSLGLLELTALASIGETRWPPWVRAADVLLVDGGDALYLACLMRQSGFLAMLQSLRHAVWVGLSAGSRRWHRGWATRSSIRSHREPTKTAPWGSSTFRSSRTWTILASTRTQRHALNVGQLRSAASPMPSATRLPFRSSTARPKSSPEEPGATLVVDLGYRTMAPDCFGSERCIVAWLRTPAFDPSDQPPTKRARIAR